MPAQERVLLGDQEEGTEVEADHWQGRKQVPVVRAVAAVAYGQAWDSSLTAQAKSVVREAAEECSVL